MTNKEIKIHDVNTFSNGTEYYLFLEKNCERCKHYVDWEEVYGEKPTCETEEALAKAYWDKEWFPKGKIKMNEDIETGGFYIPHCIDFEEQA